MSLASFHISNNKRLNKLTPRSRVIHQLVNTLWNTRVHYRVHKCLPLDPTASQMNPTTYFPNIQS